VHVRQLYAKCSSEVPVSDFPVRSLRNAFVEREETTRFVCHLHHPANEIIDCSDPAECDQRDSGTTVQATVDRDNETPAHPNSLMYEDHSISSGSI
jgi:hypothetical protein